MNCSYIEVRKGSLEYDIEDEPATAEKEEQEHISNENNSSFEESFGNDRPGDDISIG